jgi:cytochrome c556
MKTKILFCTVAFFSLTCVDLSFAEETTGNVGERKNAMSTLGRALKALAIELKKGARADFFALDLNVEVLLREAQLIEISFEKEEYGQGSESSPLIWQDSVGFSTASSLLTTAVVGLARAIEDENTGQAKAALRAVQAGCSSCHDKYRLP